MAQPSKMTVTVYSLRRIANSRNGNPRYTVNTDQGTFNTAADHSFVYLINNGWRYKNNRLANIEVSGRGTITHLTYLDE